MQEELTNLKINMSDMAKDIEYIKESLDDNKAQHKEIMQKMEEWISASKKEFAPKWVADVMKFIMGAIGLAIVGAILSLILTS